MSQTPTLSVPERASSGMLRGIVYGLITAAIWGAFIAVSRQGIHAGLHASDLAFLRYAGAGALLLPWILRHNPRTLAGVCWARGLTLTLLAGPLFVLVGASGYLFAPLAHGAVIQLGTLTLASVLLATLVLREPLGTQKAIGLLVLIAGLATIAGPALFEGNATAWKGDLLFACAGTMYAIFSMLIRHWKVNAWAATAIVSVVSGLIYSPLWLIFVGAQRLGHVPVWLLIEQVAVQAVLSGIVALFCFSRVIHLLGAGRAALFPALSPAAAILIGIPLTGDIPNLLQGVGLLVVSCGLLIVVLRR
jgi:drug/metabolite transporter (DMT)-like permease